jgi:ABC-type transport system substrate-binding protein
MFPRNVADAVAVIFSREVLEENGDLKKRMIGTGPSIVKDHEHEVEGVLARNSEYFDKGYPYIDVYRILSTPDAGTRLVTFRTGQNDILVPQIPGDMETVRKTNPMAVVETVANVQASFGLTLRQDKLPFNDVRVRRVVSMAINRQKQVDTLFEGRAIPGWGVPYFDWPDELPIVADLSPYWRYRPEGAKKLLAEAGYLNGFETKLFYVDAL